MAINYLNSINLNRNEIQDSQLIRAQVENQVNDAAVNAGATPVTGQIYYNTTEAELRQYNGTAWVSVGDITSLIQGTNINITNASGPSPTINLNDSITLAGRLYLQTVDTSTTLTNALFISGTGEIEKRALGTGAFGPTPVGAYLPLAGGTMDTGATITGDGSLFIKADTQILFRGTTPGGSVSNIASIKTVNNDYDMIELLDNNRFRWRDGMDVYLDDSAATNYMMFVASGGNHALHQFGGYEFQGLGTSSNTIMKLVGTLNAGYVELYYGNSKKLQTTSTGVTVTGIISGLTDPTANQDAATKKYVDDEIAAAVTGLLEFKGGFNANTGDLDSPLTTDLYTNTVIEVGDYYVVTTAGDFFGNTATPLTVGDSVIAQKAVPDPSITPAVEADFIVVQSDTDLATASTVGIGNVVPGTSATITAPYSSGTATLDVVNSSASQKGAVIVGGSDPIEVSYSSGTATVGIKDSAAAQKGAVIVAAGSGISVAYASGTATVTNTQSNSDYTASGTITAGNLSGTVTHAFGINTIVQTIDSSGNTVYCDISRTATTSVATIATVEATDITILVQKIG